MQSRSILGVSGKWDFVAFVSCSASDFLRKSLALIVYRHSRSSPPCSAGAGTCKVILRHPADWYGEGSIKPHAAPRQVQGGGIRYASLGSSDEEDKRGVSKRNATRGFLNKNATRVSRVKREQSFFLWDITD